ncbi:MAG: hypothetical protein AB8E15_12355 [Bdellovibrionales bacterium]
MKKLIKLFVLLGISVNLNAGFMIDDDNITNENRLDMQAISGVVADKAFTSHGLFLDLRFELSGCADELSQVAQSVIKTKNKILVVVTAFNISNTASQAGTCMAIKTVRQPLVLPVSDNDMSLYELKDVEVIFSKPNPQFNTMQM